MEHTNVIENFCYNSKTGNIQANDKFIVRYEEYCESFYFYIKYKGKKHYLTQQELTKLRKASIFFIEHYGCDFGEAINTLVKNDYLKVA